MLGKYSSLALAIGLVLAPVSGVVGAAEVVPPQELANSVVLTNTQITDGTISGTLVNNTGQRLTNLQLRVSYQWLWANDKDVDKQSPGWSTYYTLPGELKPGESMPFQYQPDAPLPQRNDGHFIPSVAVASYTAFKE